MVRYFILKSVNWRILTKFLRGYGGFFNAISQLCPKAEENYSTAHKMGDLKMGDVHLIPVETGEDEDGSKRALYIANLICQSRVGGRISAINMEKLALGMKKITIAAHAMKGTLKNLNFSKNFFKNEFPNFILIKLRFTYQELVHIYRPLIITLSSALSGLVLLIRRFLHTCKLVSYY